MCGAFVRLCLLPGDNAGSNAGDNARRNASGNARARHWSFQAAPVVTPGRAARPGAFAVSLLLCLCAGLASVDVARSAGLLHAPEWRLSDVGALHGSSNHASTVCAPLARSTAPRLSGLRAYSSVKCGDCRELSGSA